MPIPIAYSVRNLRTRKLTTVLTSAGMALVVFVFASILMLSEGLRKTLVTTGSEDNVIVIRKGSNTEVQSIIERQKAALVESVPGIATGPDGERLAAKEVVVLISLPKRGDNQASNVVIRGIGSHSLDIRREIRLTAGRLPNRGSSEIMAGMSISNRFQGGGLGEKLRFGMREWTVVGIFDAGRTGFDSEIWGDADQLMQAFRRNAYSCVIFKLADSSGFAKTKALIESDPRLTLDVKRESRYYEEQSEMMSKFLRTLGIMLTIVFSLGAMIGAMITMYAAVANRTVEIGTLRAIGFTRGAILAAYMLESLALGLLGGIIGLVFASLLQFITISTVNFQTFSEIAFTFTLTFEVVFEALVFSLVMGTIGGLLPAVRASRLKIVEALRAT